MDNEKDIDALVEAWSVAEEAWEEDKKKGRKKMKIILYTTHCPVCRGVEMMLKSKKIPYEEVEGEEPIRQLGFEAAPLLSVNGEIKVGKQIRDFINTYSRG